MARRLPIAALVVAAIVLAACTGETTDSAGQDRPPAETPADAPAESPVEAPVEPPDDSPTPSPTSSPSEPDELEYLDAIGRRLQRLKTEPRPVPNSAMPPRHLDEEKFPTSLVERTAIVSGGQPPDGIPSIDDPVFAPVGDIDFLEPDEAVLSLELEGEARAYPIRIMSWHEIVNDEVAGIPVAVTFCPLCNSAVAVDRRTEAGVLEFGTTGALYLSALVMYDRQTESVWTHFDGRAVIGTLVGTELERIPVATVPWDRFRIAHPDGQVLTTDTGYQRDYGRNPYVAYEDLDAPLNGFFTRDVDPRLAPMARVIGLGAGDEPIAIETEHASQAGVVDVQVDGRPVTVWQLAGLASPLDDRSVAGGRDIGATGAFFTDGPDDPEDFRRDGDTFVDTETGSSWNLLGRAIDGPMTGHQLRPAVHLDTFWFAWSSHHGDTRLVPD